MPFHPERLQGWTRAAVPAFPGWFAMMGPGIVWMALAQGSGELVWWPYIIAKYGLGFLFLLIPACLIQWPLVYEIGRYTAWTGESIWQGFIRLHPRFAFPLWILMLGSFLWFGAFAAAGGTALAALTQFPPRWPVSSQSLFWAYLTMAAYLTALVLSPVLYRFIEKFMWVTALVTVAGLLAVCTYPRVLVHLPTFLKGLIVPERPLPRPWDPADATRLLTAITFAGLGGFWTLFYSYWLREKGVGLSRYAGHITGVLGKKETISGTGFLPAEAPGAAARWRLWRRYLCLDSGCGIFGNLFTTLMTCFLAYVVLHPQGLFPEGWQIAVVQSEFFEVRWGALGRALFLVIAAAFLSDTWLSTIDAVSRINTDIVYHFYPGARARSPRWWYFCFLAVLTVVTSITMPLAQPGPLILISAVTGFVGTVSFSIAILILNHRVIPAYLPTFARPGRLSCVLLSFTCVAFLTLAGVYLWLVLGHDVNAW